MKPMNDRAFVVILVVMFVSILAFGAWLDRDLIAADIEQLDGTAAIADAQAWEAQRQAEEAAHIEQVKAAYQQGLREGAAGALQIAGGHSSVHALQACRALGLHTRQPQQE